MNIKCKIIGHQYVFDIHIEDNQVSGRGISCKRCNNRLIGKVNLDKALPNGIWQSTVLIPISQTKMKEHIASVEATSAPTSKKPIPPSES